MTDPLSPSPPSEDPPPADAPRPDPLPVPSLSRPDLLWEIVGFANAAIVGGVLGNRADAGVVTTVRWLLRRHRPPRDSEPVRPLMTDAQVVHAAIRAAVAVGHPRRRIRYMDLERLAPSGPEPDERVVILRLTWSRRLLVVRMNPYDPDRYEIRTIRIFLRRR
ncbi:hypothetical protein [Actinomadura sp. NTSP31]|uniref:hypothetical protein n=1 Tax=Actinomadura sp. NTSP31 TaxID=1735447 RepID=UPI0035BF1C12